MARAQRDGLWAQIKLRNVLTRHGRKVQASRYGEPFDLLVDGKTKIEVKQCRSVLKYGTRAWAFNVHRHGKIDESAVDAYVLCLDNFPGFKHSLYLLKKAPIRQHTIYIGIRTLFGEHVTGASDFKHFCETGELPQNGAAKP